MTTFNAVSQPLALKTIPEKLDVREALRAGHFVPFFQPLVTLRTGQLAGFEILARWQHPFEGLILPDTFIPAAEHDGWIGELSQQILQKAFVAAGVIRDPLTLAVNISPLQLQDPGLPEQLHNLAGDAKFPLSRIVVEITESALIDNPQNAIAVVAELKKMGCRLALDDFGTGYSSLAHLQALPFDKLKVDRSFVRSMTEKRESRKIVSAVVGLGQSLGLMTVAEGIETQEQAEMMLWLGCDLGQGYFYGHPCCAEELSDCVTKKRDKLAINPGSAWKKLSAANRDSSPTQRLAQLQAVYDGAPVGLAFIDQNLRYANLNQRLADMNGSKIEDHMGTPVSEMIPELFPYVEPYIRRALGGEALSDVEANLPSTGETRLISYHPVSDEAGEIIGVSLAVVDITERKRAETALRNSEAHYRSMVDLNPQVLWVMDPQGRNLDATPRWDKETGLMESQAVPHEWLSSVHPEDIQATVRAIAESRRNGSVIDVQYRASDAEGRTRWKRSRGAPRFDAAGNIVCWYGSIEDIDAPSRQKKPRFGTRLRKRVETRALADRGYTTVLEEERRDQLLHDLEILDTPPEPEFDDLVALTSEICRTPICLISLIDSERQWFKAAIGLDRSETPLTASFCINAIAQRELFVVENAKEDERFKNNPLVVGAPHICFYAGMPLSSGNGVLIGTLCVIDTVPRTLSPSQFKALSILSHQVQALIELRYERRSQRRSTIHKTSGARLVI
jgi:PAS domain S-box-containing protein